MNQIRWVKKSIWREEKWTLYHKSVLGRGQLEFQPHLLQTVQIHFLVLLFGLLHVTLRRTVHLFWPIVSMHTVVNRHLFLRYHAWLLLVLCWLLCYVALAQVMVVAELRFLWWLQIWRWSVIRKIHHVVLFIVLILRAGFFF